MRKVRNEAGADRIGHAREHVAAPPRRVMNSRRLISLPKSPRTKPSTSNRRCCASQQKSDRRGPKWVKLGGKRRSATRLVVPDEQTLAGVGGRPVQCQKAT